MNLEEYIQELKSCSDLDCLRHMLHIHDNLPIFMKAEYGEVLSDLKNSAQNNDLFSGSYTLDTSRKLSKKKYKFDEFLYVPGTVIFELSENIGDTDCTNFGFTENSEIESHIKFQKNNFNLTFCFWPYQEKKVPEKRSSEVLAEVISDILNYSIKKGYSSCVPRMYPPIYFPEENATKTN